MTAKVVCLEFEFHAVREFSTMIVKAPKPETIPSSGGKKDKGRIFQNHTLKACVTKVFFLLLFFFSKCGGIKVDTKSSFYAIYSVCL